MPRILLPNTGRPLTPVAAVAATASQPAPLQPIPRLRRLVDEELTSVEDLHTREKAELHEQLETQKEQHANDLAEIQEKTNTVEERNKRQDHQLRSFQASLETMIENKDTQIAQVEKQKRGLETLMELQQTYQELLRQRDAAMLVHINERKGRLEKFIERVGQSKELAQQAEATLKRTRSGIEAAEERARERDDRLAKLSRDVDQDKTVIRQAKAKLEEHLKRMKTLERENARLQSVEAQNAVSAEELQQTKTKLEIVETANRSLQERIHTADADLEVSNAELQASIADRDAANGRVAQLEAELARQPQVPAASQARLHRTRAPRSENLSSGWLPLPRRLRIVAWFACKRRIRIL